MDRQHSILSYIYCASELQGRPVTLRKVADICGLECFFMTSLDLCIFDLEL